MPYLSASAVVIHYEEALGPISSALPLLSVYGLFATTVLSIQHCN